MTPKPLDLVYETAVQATTDRIDMNESCSKVAQFAMSKEQFQVASGKNQKTNVGPGSLEARRNANTWTHHLIEVVTKYLASRNKADNDELCLWDRAEAHDTSRWKNAVHSVHADCVSTARHEIDDQRLSPRLDQTPRIIMEVLAKQNIGPV